MHSNKQLNTINTTS